MDSSGAFFWVGYLLGICSLALFTAIYKALKPDGVRALKPRRPVEERSYNCDECGEGILELKRAGIFVWGRCTACKHEVEFELLDEAANEWGAAIPQSANAVNPQTAIDSSEERQQKERLNL